jgi:hypothetical protein
LVLGINASFDVCVLGSVLIRHSLALEDVIYVLLDLMPIAGAKPTYAHAIQHHALRVSQLAT